MIDQWIATNVRLTFFPEASGKIDWAPVWSALVGDVEPLSINDNRSNDTLVISGPYEEESLRIIISNNKCDIILSPRIVDPVMELPPNLGLFSERLELFSPWMAQLTTSEYIPNVTRIAFGANLVQVYDSEGDSLKALKKYLQKLDFAGMSTNDLLYQVNRPHISTIIPELVLNRLSTWRQVQQAILRINTGHVDETHTRSVFVVQLTLDMSTDITRVKSLPPKSVHAVFLELVEKGVWISQNGDKK